MRLSVRSPRLVIVFVCLLLLGITKAAQASASLTFQGYVQTLGAQLGAAGITLNHPSDIVVDPQGDIFIADTLNGQIVEVNAHGAASVLTIAGLGKPRDR